MEIGLGERCYWGGFFRKLVLQVMVGHRAYRCVRPDIFGRFNHINDGVNRQDDAHETDGSADGTHQRQRQKVAAHGDTGIADSGEHCDEEPGNHRAQRQFKAGILHDKE